MRKTRVLSWVLVGVLACSLAVTLSVGTAPSAHAQANSVPYLGGMDLMGYCRSQGYVSVRTIGTTYYSWRCVSSTGADISFSMQAACQWQYHTPNAWDQTDNFYSATGGGCWFGHLRGGVNLRGYCRSLGYADVTLRGNTVYDWSCVQVVSPWTYYIPISFDFGGSDPNMTNACIWTYNISVARFADFYTATSGQCIG
jgi:hypothetical protein